MPLLVLALLGCSETGLSAQTPPANTEVPDIQIRPDFLTMGPLGSG